MDFDQCYLLVQVAGWGGKLRNFGVNDMWIQTVFPSHLFVQAICFPEYCFPGLQNQHNGGGIFHPWEALTLNLFSASLFDSEFLPFLPLMPKAWPPVHWCWIKFWKQSFGWSRNLAPLGARQRRTQQDCALKSSVSQPWGIWWGVL